MSTTAALETPVQTVWPTSPWRWPEAPDPHLIAGFKRQLARQAAAPGDLIGWKIGGNDLGARMRWGIGSCVFGYLTDATCRSGDQAYFIGDAKCAAVEPEIWLEILCDLSGEEPPEAIGEAMGRIGLAAELIDVRGRFDDIATVLEGNIFHRAATFAEPALSLDAKSLGQELLTVHRNGDEQWRLPATLLVPDLREAVAFVAMGLSRRGDRLRAGQRILSGVLTPFPLWVRPGDTVVLSAGALGAITLTFAERETL